MKEHHGKPDDEEDEERPDEWDEAAAAAEEDDLEVPQAIEGMRAKAIAAKANIGQEVFYLVKWRGLNNCMTWEAREAVERFCPRLVGRFEGAACKLNITYPASPLLAPGMPPGFGGVAPLQPRRGIGRPPKLRGGPIGRPRKRPLVDPASQALPFLPPGSIPQMPGLIPPMTSAAIPGMPAVPAVPVPPQVPAAQMPVPGPAPMPTPVRPIQTGPHVLDAKAVNALYASTSPLGRASILQATGGDAVPAPMPPTANSSDDDGEIQQPAPPPPPSQLMLEGEVPISMPGVYGAAASVLDSSGALRRPIPASLQMKQQIEAARFPTSQQKITTAPQYTMPAGASKAATSPGTGSESEDIDDPSVQQTRP